MLKVEECLKKYVEYLQEKDKYGTNPVTALDYSSLYPSLIMTYNLSPEYLITDYDYKERLKEKYDIHAIEFIYNYEDFEGIQHSKTIKGWTVRHNNDHKFGLYPEILSDLFSQRAEMKKSLFIYKEKKEHMEKEFNGDKTLLDNNKEYQDCLFQLKYCDTKQKALKVYMNCFYGELGNKNSPLFILELAGGITSAGQMNLKKVKKFIEDKKCKTYYGDSVSGETPIYIHKNQTANEDVIAIEDLFKQYECNYYLDERTKTKEIIDTRMYGISVMSDNGWTRINKIIRHKTDKKMYRITTQSGFVDTTEDHSLLDKYGNKIKPTDCKIGGELLHWTIKSPSATKSNKIIYLKTDTNLIRKQKEFINEGAKCKGNKITSIEYLGKCEGYVYDLETESHHFGAGVGQIVVHNTDSLYFTFSNESFLDIHRNYLTTNKSVKLNKEEYCAQLVERTFNLVKSMAVEVNSYLKDDNGTKYLKMAYEEVLYPVVFLARKKYYGIAHEGLVNFKPKELFIRGLEVKKRGVSEILRIVCLETMWESVDIFNRFTLRELVIKKVDYIFSKQWEIEEFIQTALWKPNKKNQTLITYVNRMIADGRDPPSPYERFNYVIVKIKDPLRLYDFKGRKIDIKKGDKMEYLEYVIENNMEIDLEYYFSKQLIGQFARLISYDSEFHQFKQSFTIGEFFEEEEMEILDNKTINNCKRYLKEYAKKYTGEEQYGSMYKKAYRTINSLVKTERQSMCKKNKNAIIMFNHKEELIDGKVVDIRVIIMEKIKSILSEDKIKNSIELESENSWKSMKKSNMDVTKLFNRKKNSFLNNLLETHQRNFEKLTIDLIKFTRDKKIDNIIFNTGEQNISPLMKKILSGSKDIFEDEEQIESKIKNLYYDSIKKMINPETFTNSLEEDMEVAYKMFINLIAIKKNKKILKNIMEINILNIEKQVNKNQTKYIKGFRL